MEIVMSIIGNKYFQTWIGAMCAHLLSLHSDDFKGTIPFIKKFFPSRSETFYFRVDFAILPIIGALLATILLEPATLRTSIFSGLSWSVSLIAMLKRESNSKGSKK